MSADVATPVVSRKTMGKSSFAGGFRTSGEDPQQLPWCPKGAKVDYTKQGPCKKRKRKVDHKKRKPVYRVPLKKEDGNLESQIVEYHCDFPNRVVIRLEYLMNTTKVRLNDRDYMDDFYVKLLGEEKLAAMRAAEEREKAELNRMKKLIINGFYWDIPPELYYLHRHPVFRVNKLLTRLTNLDTDLFTMQDEITPVEPYEYDGNKFFKHLHDEGEVWIPEHQQKYDELKLEGKIYRAKLRLLIKKKEEEAKQKVDQITTQMLLYNYPSTPEKGSKGKFENESKKSVRYMMHEDEIRRQETEDKLLSSALRLETSAPMSALSMAASRINSKAKMEIANLHEKIKKSYELQEKRDMELDLKRMEHESEYVDRFNYERENVLLNYVRRRRLRDVYAIFDEEEERLKNEAMEKEKEGEMSNASLPPTPAAPPPTTTIGPGGQMEGRAMVSLAPSKIPSKTDQQELFSRLKKHYDVFPHNFKQYHCYQDAVLGHLDKIADGQKMIDYADQIVDMFIREQCKATDHAAKELQTVNKEDLEPEKKKKVEENEEEEEGEGEDGEEEGEGEGEGEEEEGEGEEEEEEGNDDDVEGSTKIQEPSAGKGAKIPSFSSDKADDGEEEGEEEEEEEEE